MEPCPGTAKDGPDSVQRQLLRTLEASISMPFKPAGSKFSFRKSPPLEVARSPSRPQARSPSRPPALPGGKAQHITSSSLSSQPNSGALSFYRLMDSIVDLREVSIPALYLADISNTLVVAPSVTGSVLIRNAKNCMLAVGCHQVPMRLPSRPRAS